MLAPPKRYLVTIIGLMLVLGAGCSNPVVRQQVDDFTAYFNTYYNAEEAYRKGTFDALSRQEDVNPATFIPVFPFPAAGVSGGELDKAVRKGADLLRNHGDSKWVDDALILIGKSYFYRQEYVGAEQKFREALAVDTPRREEAQFWLARTLVQSGAVEDARALVVPSVPEEASRDEPTAQLQILLAELELGQGNLEEAARFLSFGVQGLGRSDLKARSLFALGQLREELGDFEGAVAAYAEVPSQKPPYELVYAAAIAEARVLGDDLRRASGLVKVRALLRDDKNYDSRFELWVLEARLLAALGEPDRAIALLDELLMGDERARLGRSKGVIHYHLANLIYQHEEDFERASAHFDSSGTAASAPPGSVRPENRLQAGFTREAILDARQRSQNFQSFTNVYLRVMEMDSLLRLGALPQDSFDAVILALREERAEELMRLAEQRMAQQAEASFNRVSTTQSQAGGGYGTGGNDPSAGFLGHLDPTRVEENRMQFLDRWGERPLAPNWRRRAALTGQMMAQLASESAGPGDIQQISVDSTGLPEIDISGIPRDSASFAEMQAVRASARYELGTTLFLTLSRPDSAAYWYRLVVEEDAEQQVAQRARYALAEVQRALGDEMAATALFEQIVRDMPTTVFAERAREALGLAQATQYTPPSQQPEVVREVVDLLTAGQYDEAYHRAVALSADTTDVEGRQRALFIALSSTVSVALRDSLHQASDHPFEPSDSTSLGAFFRQTETALQGGSFSERARTLAALIPPPPFIPQPSLDSTSPAINPDSLGSDGRLEPNTFLPPSSDSTATEVGLESSTDSVAARPARPVESTPRRRPSAEGERRSAPQASEEGRRNPPPSEAAPAARRRSVPE